MSSAQRGFARLGCVVVSIHVTEKMVILSASEESSVMFAAPAQGASVLMDSSLHSE